MCPPSMTTLESGDMDKLPAKIAAVAADATSAGVALGLDGSQRYVKGLSSPLGPGGVRPLPGSRRPAACRRAPQTGGLWRPGRTPTFRRRARPGGPPALPFAHWPAANTRAGRTSREDPGPPAAGRPAPPPPADRSGAGQRAPAPEPDPAGGSRPAAGETRSAHGPAGLGPT